MESTKYKDIKFSGRMPSKITRRITDHEYELIPRGVYNDHISEFQLREEGKSGKFLSNDIYDLLLLNDIDVLKSLHFLSRAPIVDEGSDEEITPQTDTDERIVILTEWGIDILNYKQLDAIQPISKAKIASPAERAVHSKAKNEIIRPFNSIFRYGSLLNDLACTNQQTLQDCHEKCKEMQTIANANDRQSSLRYPKKIEPNDMIVRSRGLSFRGRGLLDTTMGWTKASNVHETNLGDITNNPIGSGLVTFTNDFHPSTLEFKQPSEPKRAGAVDKEKGIVAKNLDSPPEATSKNDEFTNIYNFNSIESIASKAADNSEIVCANGSDVIQSTSTDLKSPKIVVNQTIQPTTTFAQALEDSSVAIEPELSCGEELWVKEEQKKMFKGWRRDIDEEEKDVPRENEEIEDDVKLRAGSISRDAAVAESPNKAAEPKRLSRLEKLMQKNIQPNQIVDSTKTEQIAPIIESVQEDFKDDLRLPPLPSKEIRANEDINSNVGVDRPVYVIQFTVDPVQSFDIAPISVNSGTPQPDLANPIDENLENSVSAAISIQNSSEKQEVISLVDIDECNFGTMRKDLDDIKHEDLLDDEDLAEQLTITRKDLERFDIEQEIPADTVSLKNDQITDPQKNNAIQNALIEEGKRADNENAATTVKSEKVSENQDLAHSTIIHNFNGLGGPEELEKKKSSVLNLKKLFGGKSKSNLNEQDYHNQVASDKNNVLPNEDEQSEEVKNKKSGFKSFFGGKSKSKTNLHENNLSSNDESDRKSVLNEDEISEVKKSNVHNLKSLFGGKSKSKPNLNERISISQDEPERKSVVDGEGPVEELEMKKSSVSNLKKLFGGKSKSKSNLNELDDMKQDASSRNSVLNEEESSEGIDNKKSGFLTRKSFFGGKTKSKNNVNDVQNDAKPNSIPFTAAATAVSSSGSTLMLKERENHKHGLLGTSDKVESTVADSSKIEAEAKILGGLSVVNASVAPEKDSSSNRKERKIGPNSVKFLNAMDIAAIQSRYNPENENVKAVVNSTDRLNDSRKPASVSNVSSRNDINAIDTAAINNTYKTEERSSKIVVEPTDRQNDSLKIASNNDLRAASDLSKSAEGINREHDSEKLLSNSVNVTWKGHKCEIKILDFQLHCNEEGKSKPFKPYLPIPLRQIICLTIENTTEVLITCVINPKGESMGKEFKTILLTFAKPIEAKQWRENMINLIFGGGYEDFLKREILILVEKSDKESQKILEKHVHEILVGSKRPFKVEGKTVVNKVTQFNEFSVANLLEKQNFKKLGIIHVTNPDFVPRLQQVLVRDRHADNLSNYMVEKEPVDCALDIVRCERYSNLAAVGKKNQSILHISGVQFKRENGEKGVFGIFKK